MADQKPQFSNFKDAYCAYYRVTPEKYGESVLWRSLPLTRRLLALPILAFNRTFFATDLDIIRSLGPMQSSENFSLQLDELHAVNRLERNLRRGILGIRASGSRLMDLWKVVEPYVTPPPEPVFSRVPGQAEVVGVGRSLEAVGRTAAAPLSSQAPAPVARLSPAAVRNVGRNVNRENPSHLSSSPASAPAAPLPVDAADISAMVIRRLKRACDDTVLGVPVDDAVLNAGLDSVPQFMRLLEINGATHPAFKWLHLQLSNAERLRDLQDENAGLKAVLAEQMVQLARLRGSVRD